MKKERERERERFSLRVALLCRAGRRESLEGEKKNSLQPLLEATFWFGFWFFLVSFFNLFSDTPPPPSLQTTTTNHDGLLRPGHHGPGPAARARRRRRGHGLAHPLAGRPPALRRRGLCRVALPGRGHRRRQVHPRPAHGLLAGLRVPRVRLARGRRGRAEEVQLAADPRVAGLRVQAQLGEPRRREERAGR